MDCIKKANEYLTKESKIITDDEFRPKYHFSPLVGWCNDPHGIIHFNDEYHIFFQYNPYKTNNELIYWGHVTTKDFVHFGDVSCALAPDMEYDNRGCWSGSAIVIENVLYLFYTGFALADDGKYYQTICMATSKDGKTFVKSKANPLIDRRNIPNFASIYDFRDPCIFKENDDYYLIVGSKNDDKAMLLLYKSHDLSNFEFVKVLVRSSNHGTMFECPNILKFKDKNFIIMSPQNIPASNDSYFNISSSLYFEIPKNYLTHECKIESTREIDHGFEFYAPTINDEDKIIVAREQMWGRRYYLDEVHSRYINNFTLFKKIYYQDNELVFKPLDIYNSLFINEFHEKIKLIKNKEVIYRFSKNYHLVIEFIPRLETIFECKLSKQNDEYILLKFDFLNKIIEINREKLKIQLNGVEKTSSSKGVRYLKLNSENEIYRIEIFVDLPSIEVFLRNYKDSISMLSFSKGSECSLLSNDDIEISVIKHDIEVK